MVQGVYTDIVCKQKHSKFIPQTHQKHVREYFKKSPYKGLLLIHKLGSGKTCTSIITADFLLSLKKDFNKVYVLSPGSLRQGWINEYCGVCGASSQVLENHYSFMTYNYAVNKYLPKNFTFNNSICIIDEVHNFINTVKNQAKTATYIYNKLMTANPCKILALSGTPIYNNIYEFAILGNLLKPETFPNIIVNKTLHEELFMKDFTIQPDGSIVPKDSQKFKEQISGIISFFPGAGENMYPTVIEEPIDKILMTESQYNDYLKAHTIEKKVLGMGMKQAQNMNLFFLFQLSSKNILSRRISNFHYPDIAYVTSDKDENDKKIKIRDDTFEKDGGWITKQLFSHGQIKKYSAKFAKLLENILNNYSSKHMIFTFFKTHGGVNILSLLFNMCGIKTAIFSGDLNDQKREEILKIYNHRKNRYGGLIKVIFVTDAGAEGITMLETGHVHVLESDKRENKIQQVIGRAVRYKSHINMPKDEQTVHIWRYWSVYGEDNDEIKDKGIDKILYDKGQFKLKTINTFIDLLIKASI